MGTKNPAFTPARGSEGGLQNCEQARLFPHPVFGATVARSHNRDLMSMNKQVFWLRGRPTRFAFLLKKQWFKRSFRRSIQRRSPRGILTHFPILP